MADTVEPLPMAPDALQQTFTDLKLQNFAAGGSAPRDGLTDAIKKNPKLLEHTFIGYDGRKTNLLAELIRTDHSELALMVLKNYKDQIPAALVKGYLVEEEKPADKNAAEKKAEDKKEVKPAEQKKETVQVRLSPLALSVGRSSELSSELISQGAGIENVTKDGGNILHAMMASYSPDYVRSMLAYLDKEQTAEARKALYEAKDEKGKKPIETVVYPPVMVPFVEKQYLTKKDLESFGNDWIDRCNKVIWAKGNYDTEFDKSCSDVFSMHEALQKAGISRPVSYRLGEQLISFGRSNINCAGDSYSRLHTACQYADADTKNKWLAKSVVYQGDMRFPAAASHLLMDKGAMPADQATVNAAIYAEEIDVVERVLTAAGRNAPALMDQPGNSSLHYALTCGFAAPQKRLPIVALVASRGAKVTKESYHEPMGAHIAGNDTATQKIVIDRCMKMHMPYPQDLETKLAKKWDEEDKQAAPGAKTLKERLDIGEQMKKWKDDDKLRNLLKGASGRAPDAAQPKEFAGVEDLNTLTAAFPGVRRSLARAG